MNRQRLILAALVGVLLLAVGYSIIRFPRQQEAGKSSSPLGAASAGKKKQLQGEDNRVRLDLLGKNRTGFTGFKKNIFAPIFRDLSKLPPVRAVIPAPPPPPPPPVLAPPPPPPATTRT